MARESSIPDYGRGARVGVVAWVGGVVISILFGSLGVFRFWPDWEFVGGPLTFVTWVVAVYNGAHAPAALLGLAGWVPVLAALSGGFYLAKTDGASFVGGATVAVGYAGATAVSEVFVIVLAGVPPGNSVVRIVSAGILAVVAGGLGTVLYNYQGRTAADRADRRNRDGATGRSTPDASRAYPDSHEGGTEDEDGVAYPDWGDEDDRR